MRTRTFAITCLGWLLILGGCSKVIRTDACSDQETNFATYKTFAFLDQSGKPARLDDPLAKTPDSRQAVRQIVESKLSEQGITRDRINDADFLIAIYAGDDDKLTAEMTRWHYSFGRHWHFEDDKSYTKGSLILDFFDNEENRLIWRGSIPGLVNDDGKLSGKTEEAISELLDTYPPDLQPRKSGF